MNHSTPAQAAWQVLPLVPDLAPAYRAFTFPAWRGLLDVLDNPAVVAMGVVLDGKPVGLALGHLAEAGSAMLDSVYVTPAMRCRGMAAAAVAALASACRARGAHTLSCTYMSGQPTTPAFEALLARGGWSAPERRMLVVQATLDSIRHAPWMREYPLPADMEIVPWLSLDEAAREALRASHAAKAWIAPDLVPFDHEADCEPLTSLALRWKGEVVGWVINHRVDKVLRFTCSFMHPRLQRMGRIVLLYNAAVARMPEAGLNTGMWTVPVWHAGMSAFATRWMAPYATRFDDTRGSRLVLDPDRA